MRSDDPAAAHIMQLVDGFWPIHVLAALAQFKIPEALADGPATAAGVAQQLGLREYELFRLLRAGSALGVCQDLGGRHASWHSSSVQAMAYTMAANRHITPKPGQGCPRILAARRWQNPRSIPPGTSAHGQIFGDRHVISVHDIPGVAARR